MVSPTALVFLPIALFLHSGWIFIHPGACTTKETTECTLICTDIYYPMCGWSPTTGYKTFSSLCHFKLENDCKNGDYKYVNEGECEYEGIVNGCPRICSLIYSPVCGYSKTEGYKTFSNGCKLQEEVECLLKDYEFFHKGECTKGELDRCKNDKNPVCARSPTKGYRTFPNFCFFSLENSCNNGDYKFVHEGKCKHEGMAENCEVVCTDIYSPVCGYSETQGYRTFPNSCEIEVENQCFYGDFVEKHEGECTEEDKGVCTDEYNPVCAKSPTKGYKTFPNYCEFLLENDCNSGDYEIVHKGKCKYEGMVEECSIICTADFTPVCGYSQTQGYKSFSNSCELDKENKCFYGDYKLIHQEQCTKEEIEMPCRYICPRIYLPVCAYNEYKGFKTFPSSCELEKANKCEYADYTLIHEGACTNTDCDGDCDYICPQYYIGICGNSKENGFKTFANQCFLDRENCMTNSDYTVAHSGKCTPFEIGKVCNIYCLEIYEPVCGRSPRLGYKTFPNFCYLDRANSCEYLDYIFMHEGECYPKEVCYSCKKITH